MGSWRDPVEAPLSKASLRSRDWAIWAFGLFQSKFPRTWLQ